MKSHTASSQSAKSPGKQVLDANELFKGQRDVEILFKNEIYRLRITRNDKLILTK